MQKNVSCLKKRKRQSHKRLFLGIVSQTTDSLTEDLSKIFHDNKDKLLDEHQIFFDPNDVGVGSCHSACGNPNC